MSNNFEKLDKHSFVTKLAGFEHTMYIQKNQTHTKINNNDIPLVQGKNIRNGFFVQHHDWFIKKEISDKLVRSKLNKKCILVPYVGSNLGEVGIFYNDYECHMASNIAKIELIDDYFDIEFLKYYLLSNTGQKYLFQAKQGSSQPNITMEAIRNTLVFDINKKTQYKIAKALKMLDNKILLNNKINAELEQMAKTLYDYWFVQFDFPDQNGNPYKSSGGKMTYNPALKREIPEDWEVKTIENIEKDIITGKTPNTKNLENYNGAIPFITIDDIRGNLFVTNTKVKLSSSGANTQKNKFLEPNSLCVTCIATPGLLGFTTELSQTNQQINSIVIKDKSNTEYLYFAIKDYFEFSKGAKTGNTFANMNKGDFSNIPLIYPDKNIKNEYHKIVSPVFKRVKNNLLQNQKLAELRDWLLPMLMNGQVTISKSTEPNIGE